MEKHLPLGDLGAKPGKPDGSKAVPLHGIIWAMLSGGAMLTMAMMGPRPDFAVLLPAVAAVLSALGSLAHEAAMLPARRS